MAKLRLVLFLGFFPLIASAITINNFSPKSITATWDSGTPGAISNASGAWNLDATNFTYDNGVKNSPFCQGCNVSFGAASGGAAGVVTNTITQRINSMTFGPVGSGNFTITGGQISCVNSSSCTYTTNVSGTIESVITGSLPLIKEGPQTLTLSATNTYSGGTTLSMGSLTGTSTNAFGSGTITLGDANTGATNITLNFNVPGGLAGPPAATLSNPIIVSSLGSGTVTINQDVSYSTINGLMTLNRPTTLSTNAADRADVSSKITGNVGTLTIAANPRLTMTNSLADASDFTGDVVINTGTLQINTPYPLPPTADVTVNASGTFRVIGGANATIAIDALNGSGPLTGNSSGGNNLKTLSIGNDGGTGTFSGTIVNGSGADILAITKAGTGTETLSGLHTYTGATTVTGGTLRFSMTANDSNTSSGFAISSGATLNIDVPSGSARISSGNPTISGGGTFTKTSGSSLYLANNPAQTNFSMSSTGLIDVQGGGLLSISTSATNTADLTIASGASVALNGGGGNATSYFDVLSGPGTFTIDGPAGSRTASFGNGNGSGTFTGPITNGTGTLSIAKAGTGIQTLTAVNTYTGSTTVSGGTLQISGNGSLGSGNYAGAIADSATLTYSSSATQAFSGGFTGTGRLIKDTSASTLTLSGTSVNYTGTTTINAGKLVLSGTTNYNSPTTINSGGTLSYTHNANYTDAGTAADITLNTGGTLENTNPANYTVINGTVTVAGTATINQTSNATAVQGEGFYLDDGILGPGTLTINATNAGSGVNLRNNDSTTFSGTLIVNGIANSTAFSGSGIGVGGCSICLQNADITLNGTMELLNGGIGWANGGGGAFTMGALNGTGVMVGNFGGTGFTTVTLGNTSTGGSFSGVISNGTNNTTSITKIGTGTQTLSGANSYTGTMTVNGGTLKLVNSAISVGSNSTINSGGILEVNATANQGFTATQALNSTVSGPGTLNVTGNGTSWIGIQPTSYPSTGTINILNNGRLFFWWGLSTTMDVIVATGGQLALGNRNASIGTLTGGGDIFQGYNGNTQTLTLGTDNGTGTFSGIIHGNNTSAVLGNFEFGILAVAKNGTGIQTLSGANTYSGGTTVNTGGTLKAGSTTAFGTGPITVNSGGTLDCANFQITNNITNYGSVINCATTGRAIFYSSGNYKVPAGKTSINYLVVAGGGGGGGGGGAEVAGSGGGAGGMLAGSVAVTAGTNYVITVGAGGAPVLNATLTRGGNSSIGALVVATGGGSGQAGGGNAYTGGNSGGSGGGTVGTNNGANGAAGGLGNVGTAGQGNAGGAGSGTIGNNQISGGGGGGAGGVGTAGSTAAINAAGGPGVNNSLSGAAVTYAAGGRGGMSIGNANGSNGAANTGNGGGGGDGAMGTTATAGSGGSGIVIIVAP